MLFTQLIEVSILITNTINTEVGKFDLYPENFLKSHFAGKN